MPKRTYQPKTRKRAKVHGFRARMATKSGQTVLKRRRSKVRSKIAIWIENRRWGDFLV